MGIHLAELTGRRDIANDFETVASSEISDHIVAAQRSASNGARVSVRTNVSVQAFRWLRREQTLPWLGALGSRMTHIPTEEGLTRGAQRMQPCTPDMEHQVRTQSLPAIAPIPPPNGATSRCVQIISLDLAGMGLEGNLSEGRWPFLQDLAHLEVVTVNDNPYLTGHFQDTLSRGLRQVSATGTGARCALFHVAHGMKQLSDATPCSKAAGACPFCCECECKRNVHVHGGAMITWA